MKSLLKILPVLIFMLSSCHVQNKLFVAKYETSINKKSACREQSEIASYFTSPDVKDLADKSGQNAITRLKLKTSDNIDKCAYRIKSAELIVTDKCGGKDEVNVPTLVLTYQVKIEEVKGGSIKEFHSDTTIFKSQTLAFSGKQAGLPDKKAIISTLSEKTFSKVNSALLRKK